MSLLGRLTGMIHRGDFLAPHPIETRRVSEANGFLSPRLRFAPRLVVRINPGYRTAACEACFTIAPISTVSRIEGQKLAPLRLPEEPRWVAQTSFDRHREPRLGRPFFLKPMPLVDHVGQWLARNESLHVVVQHAVAAIKRMRIDPGHMRREQHVRQLPERVI